MFLQKLELHGFKSFADKTEVEFLPPSPSSKGITAVVGPNGSGKSNVADGLRWVLGEQSAKALRGKKSEDVIFSGSEKRARSGFAEVTLTLNNEDGSLPFDFSEVTVSRRVYRDGASEYLINKGKVRLSDVQLLLAQAQVGARSYSVIGQGQIDAVLLATPQERKEFFDEAAGVRQFQIKRHQATIKLESTRENLSQAEMLVAEIEPRLRSLQRQVKRLEERGAIEEELHAAKHQYYGTLWADLSVHLNTKRTAVSRLEEEWKAKEALLDEAKGALSGLEREEGDGAEFSRLQERYRTLLDERAGLREREIVAKSKLEIAAQVKRQSAPTALPLSKIIEEVTAIGEGQDRVLASLTKAKTAADAKAAAAALTEVHEATLSLRERLERPAPEKTTAQPAADPEVLAEISRLEAASAELTTKLAEANEAMQRYHQGEQKKKEKFFGLQHALQEKVSTALGLERRLNDERIELARLDTRREALEQELRQELGERADRAIASFERDPETTPELLLPRIQKLKYQLELIGGIDPESVREFGETRDRHEFLVAQIADLHKSIDDLGRVVAELDLTIKTKSESAFRDLNRDFDRFFKSLFGGGKAELVQLRGEVTDDEDGDEAAEATTDNERITGIDVKATPPGKKIGNIAMLSGGERALVSIALICAIMISNPSPFVVLDEVDAALDESNAAKFAGIIEELAERTQFIVITHNRYTMQKANVLYGVTMGDDSVSKLLSINLDEVGELKHKGKAKMAV